MSTAAGPYSSTSPTVWQSPATSRRTFFHVASKTRLSPLHVAHPSVGDDYNSRPSDSDSPSLFNPANSGSGDISSVSFSISQPFKTAPFPSSPFSILFLFPNPVCLVQSTSQAILPVGLSCALIMVTSSDTPKPANAANGHKTVSIIIRPRIILTFDSRAALRSLER